MKIKIMEKIIVIICIAIGGFLLNSVYLCHAQTPPASATQTSTTNLPPETQQTAPQVPQQKSSDANAKLNTSNSETNITALFDDPVIAKVNGFEIKQSALDEVTTGIKAAAAANNQTISPEKMLDTERQMLQRLIQIRILMQKATDTDKAVGKVKAEEQLTALLVRAGSQEEFDRQLKVVGMTSDELHTKITQEAIATAALTRELGVTVTDSEAKKYYLDHPNDFINATTREKTSYATVADKIKDFLIQQQTQKIAPAYLENLKKLADVKILDANLK